jgi:hypothetical protein
MQLAQASASVAAAMERRPIRMRYRSEAPLPMQITDGTMSCMRLALATSSVRMVAVMSLGFASVVVAVACSGSDEPPPFDPGAPVQVDAAKPAPPDAGGVDPDAEADAGVRPIVDVAGFEGVTSVVADPGGRPFAYFTGRQQGGAAGIFRVTPPAAPVRLCAAGDLKVYGLIVQGGKVNALALDLVTGEGKLLVVEDNAAPGAAACPSASGAAMLTPSETAQLRYVHSKYYYLGQSGSIMAFDGTNETEALTSDATGFLPELGATQDLLVAVDTDLGNPGEAARVVTLGAGGQRTTLRRAPAPEDVAFAVTDGRVAFFDRPAPERLQLYSQSLPMGPRVNAMSLVNAGRDAAPVFCGTSSTSAVLSVPETTLPGGYYLFGLGNASISRVIGLPADLPGEAYPCALDSEHFYWISGVVPDVATLRYVRTRP